MAEINSSNGKQFPKAGVQKAKKLSTRVDLTPMVDLGFLLITFFIFTTSISQPNALGLVLPADGDNISVPESKTLNLVLSENNRIQYYPGNDVGKQTCTDFSPQGIRKVIHDMQQAVRARHGMNEQLIVLIRPTDAASYKNIVDILDEMVILNVKKYALMEENPKESAKASDQHRPC